MRLEIAGGIPTWEAAPAFRHQSHWFRIQSSIRPTAVGDAARGCVHVSDVYIRFPDGSLKRPDIAIYCRTPEEQTEAITMLPEAVIEIISPGYEGKDLAIGVPFYLRSGLKDVIVFYRKLATFRHFRPGRRPESRASSPVTIVLACGCEVTPEADCAIACMRRRTRLRRRW